MRGSEGALPDIALRDRVLAHLVELDQYQERRHTLRLGGDLLQEAASSGLTKWGDAPEYWAAMIELRRDGLVAWEPPAWPRVSPDAPTADEVFNSRGFRLTLEGRREARALATSLRQQARANDPQTRPGVPPPLSKDPRRVMVVHGRNLAARNAVFAFLGAVGLLPVE